MTSRIKFLALQLEIINFPVLIKFSLRLTQMIVYLC